METTFHELDTMLTQHVCPTVKKFLSEYSEFSLFCLWPELCVFEEVVKLKPTLVHISSVLLATRGWHSDGSKYSN